jgi:hypothetical protein
VTENRRWVSYVRRPPCDVCKRRHNGLRCKPTDARTVDLTISVPGYIHRTLLERVPWGERSAWVSNLIRKELNL